MERFDERVVEDISRRHYLVRCPRCAHCATVVSDASYPRAGSATLTCGDCGLSRKSDETLGVGPVMTYGGARCGGCGRWVIAAPRRRKMPPPHPTVAVQCRACRHVTQIALRMVRRPGPNDPSFGLSLWLQAPCCGEVLWAWNRAHLEFLRQYVTASLRERAANVNGSLVSRLPRWIKAAKNRDEVERCIERLSAV